MKKKSVLKPVVKKTIIFMFYIFFCRFTLLVRGEKNILPRSRSRSEPVGAGRSQVFLAPWSRSRSRSKKKYQEPEPLGKKLQEPEPLKNLPAPQPWGGGSIYFLKPSFIEIHEVNVWTLM